MCVRVYACACVACVLMCVCVCVYVCVYVCECMCVYTHIHTYTHVHTHSLRECTEAVSLDRALHLLTLSHLLIVRKGLRV